MEMSQNNCEIIHKITNVTNNVSENSLQLSLPIEHSENSDQLEHPSYKHDNIAIFKVGTSKLASHLKLSIIRNVKTTLAVTKK